MRQLVRRQAPREEPCRVQPESGLAQLGMQQAVLEQVDWEDRVAGTPEGHMEEHMRMHCVDANHTQMKHRGRRVAKSGNRLDNWSIT